MCRTNESCSIYWICCWYVTLCAICASNCIQLAIVHVAPRQFDTVYGVNTLAAILNLRKMYGTHIGSMHGTSSTGRTTPPWTLLHGLPKAGIAASTPISHASWASSLLQLTACTGCMMKKPPFSGATQGMLNAELLSTCSHSYA